MQATDLPHAFCFAGGEARAEGADLPIPIALPDRVLEGLAVLVPLLGCGEEAAALAFDGLARAKGASAHALEMIAEEERVHDGLLKNIAAGLPQIDRGSAIMRAARRFHINLGRGSAAQHLGKIAAIDAAVCTVFARLAHPRGSLAPARALRTVMMRIHRDESRHVRVARALSVAEISPARLRDQGAATREAMAAMLALGADAFEALGIDADRLLRDVARLPDGLFA